MNPYDAPSIRYIRLGKAGSYFDLCRSENIIVIGFGLSDDQVLDIANGGNWALFKELRAKFSGAPGADTNQVKTFFQDRGDTLWVTNAHGYMWYAFSDGGTIKAHPLLKSSGYCYRRLSLGWRNTDESGVELLNSNIDICIKKTYQYKGTICSFGDGEVSIRELLKGKSNSIHMKSHELKRRASLDGSNFSKSSEASLNKASYLGSHVEGEDRDFHVNKSAEVSEDSHDSGNYETVYSIYNLADLLQEKGDYEASEPMYQRALAINEKMLGSNHPTTAVSLNKLAKLYSDKGDREAAEPLYRRALSICESTLGPNHPDTAKSLNNLARLLKDKGDYEAAEPLNRRALAISEKALGPDHPDTGTCLNNLALLLQTKGDYDAAEPLYRRALAISEKALGPDHPDTGTCLDNLAGLLRAKGDYDDAAEPLYRRALAISEKALGPDHPDTAKSLNNLARLLKDKGDYEAAEPLYRRALVISDNTLGPSHSYTASCVNDLAELLKYKGDYEAAESLYRRVLQIRENTLVQSHSNSVSSFHSINDLVTQTNKHIISNSGYTLNSQDIDIVHDPKSINESVKSSVNRLNSASRSQNKSFDIFVSHSSKDVEVASHLVNQLEFRDFRCWFAPRDIPAGSVGYGGHIVRAIEKCKLFLLLLSTNSVSSAEVLRELQQAKDMLSTDAIKILPIIMRDDWALGNYADDFKYHIGIIQHCRLSETESLFTTISSLLKKNISN
jgi:tetratricopeptide (TPR) repeat protein